MKKQPLFNAGPTWAMASQTLASKGFRTDTAELEVPASGPWENEAEDANARELPCGSAG